MTVLSGPLSVVSEGDLNSRDALLKAYKFLLFVYIIVFLLRVPLFDIFLGMDMEAPLSFLALFVLNAVSFAVFILVMYGCTKILMGRGSLQSTAITGIYLTAFWPFFVLIYYLYGVSSRIRGRSTSGIVSEWWFMESVAGLTAVALLLFLFFYLIVKSVPAIKYVHKVGNIRAIIICGFGYVLAFEVQNWLTMKLLFDFVKFAARTSQL